nr:MAG TPA: hypothetical protein [Caudoviricetes sp.]
MQDNIEGYNIRDLHVFLYIISLFFINRKEVI